VISGRAAVSVVAVVLLGALGQAACGGGSGAARPAAHASAPSPTPSPAVSVNPATLSAQVWGGSAGAPFVGYDDHVNWAVVNTGRDIQDLFVDLSGGDRWLDHHAIGMGSTAHCDVEPVAEGVACGPLKSGLEMAIILRAFPATPGTLNYTARFFDRTAGGLQPITHPDGSPLVFTFSETVKPQPGS
jgi:hypothetical protein